MSSPFLCSSDGSLCSLVLAGGSERSFTTVDGSTGCSTLANDSLVLSFVDESLTSTFSG